MGVFTSIAIFLTIWWTVLFAVLPWGTVTHAEAGIDKGDGGDPGAPVDLAISSICSRFRDLSEAHLLCSRPRCRLGWRARHFRW